MLLLVLFHQLLDHISELWPQPLESVLYIEGASSCRLQTAQPPWGVTNVFCPGQWKGQYSEILVSTGIGNTRGWKTIFKYHEDSQLLDWAVHHLVPGNTALSHGLMNWPRLRGFSTFDSQWSKVKKYQSFSSIAEVLVPSEHTWFSVMAQGFLCFLSMKLRDRNTGSLPVMNDMLSKDVFLNHTAHSHCSKRIITQSPDPWQLSPFSSYHWKCLRHLYLLHHCLWWDS